MSINNNGILALNAPIQHKRGTLEALMASDYVPAVGEFVAAVDTGEIRCGNGSDLWKDLPSINGAETSRENVLSVTVTAQHLSQKYIQMPSACDTGKLIKLYLQGLLMEQGIDWEVSIDEDNGAALIAWNGRGLEDLVCEGDKILVTFYENL